ncbi:uncharacterized protein LOC144117099 [Amblyomma americanum]
MLAEFWQLLSNEALVDVTLACEGLSLKAHKVVLSACSPFFQALFVENPCKHPIVILPAMRYIDLKAIVEFMYRGEVNLPLDQIAALLKTAETLKVKGLAECTNENKNGGLVTSVDGAADAGPVGTPRAESAPLSKRKGSHGPSSRASNVAASSSTAVPSGARHGSSVQASISQHTQDSIGDDVEEGDDADFDLEILDVMEEFTTTENVPEFPDVASSSQVLGYESQQSHHTGFTSDNSALVPAQRSLPSDFSITSQVDIEPSPYSLIPYDDQAIPPVVAAFPAAALSGDGASIAMAVTDASGVPAVAGPSGYQQSTPSHGTYPVPDHPTHLHLFFSASRFPHGDPSLCGASGFSFTCNAGRCAHATIASGPTERRSLVKLPCLWATIPPVVAASPAAALSGDGTSIAMAVMDV